MTEGQRQGDNIYQVSTFSALLDGVFEGEVPFSVVKKHGDFGIGTFNKLDGEMLAVDGEFYHLQGDGTIKEVKEDEKTPFAAVTFFNPSLTYRIQENGTMEHIEQFISSILPSENLFYSIRITGSFRRMKTRTVSKQEPPYSSMTDVVEEQNVSTFKDCKGTIVGFYTPQYVQGLAVAGYHLHFISEDKQGGGHIFDFEIESGTVEIGEHANLQFVLPKTKEFLEADLMHGNMAEEIEKTEG
ncbi:acetolactate decarboxylase [Priestia endophytica]|uniref:acetolactate decarboxylase n=1 Tax=Priestia endophytica TaxID=135735 RepID=UPI00124D7C10|nr:acetolactate decarboxylase [Priestia endophytica]KAB2490017.1 acetolactate decarboxylase [Priestia endophytica]